MSLRERKKRQVRAEILAAADQLIGEAGFDEVRMRDIAEAAEVSYQTLYNYFPTKALIAEALLTADVDEIATAIGDIVANFDGDLVQLLNAVNRTRMSAVDRRDRLLWREVCISLLMREEGATRLYQIVDGEAHEKLEGLLEFAQAQNLLSADVDVPIMAHTIFNISEAAMTQLIMNPKADKEDLLRMVNAQIEQLVEPHISSGRKRKTVTA